LVAKHSDQQVGERELWSGLTFVRYREWLMES